MLQPLVNCCCSVSPSSFSFLLTCIKKTTRNELARLGMGTIFLVGERSEPLSRVFNDKPRDMVVSLRTYVSNTHAHVRMSVCVFCDRNSNAKNGRLSSLNNKSSGTSKECKTLKGERRMIFIFNRLGSSLGTTLRNATNATFMTVQAKRASQGFRGQAERTRGSSLNYGYISFCSSSTLRFPYKPLASALRLRCVA